MSPILRPAGSFACAEQLEIQRGCDGGSPETIDTQLFFKGHRAAAVRFYLVPRC
jgi:hypothetical protein